MNNNIQLFVYYIIYLLLVHNSSTIRKGHVINAIKSQKILWFAWCVAQWFTREEIAASNSLATKVRNTKISHLFLKKYIYYIYWFLKIILATCETVLHSQECGGGTGIFLSVNSSTIIVVRGKRACVWGSVFLDIFGEEDKELK